VEVSVKPFLHLLLGLLLVTSVGSFADSVNNFSNLNVNFNIYPNGGSGDNLGGRIFGPGVNVFAGGGSPNEWFNNDQGFAPGSTGGGSTTFFFDAVGGNIGSVGLTPGSEIFSSTFDTNSFIFPTSPHNLQTFTVTLPGLIGAIMIVNCTDTECDTYNLYTNFGKLTLSFTYYSASDAWFGTSGSFTTTPEPATLGLVAFGIGAAAWRKHRINACAT
jgi:hypothetical protein